jgi:hypothetical protein
MKPHRLRFRLGMGLLTWFLFTRLPNQFVLAILLTLFPKEHIPQVTLELDRLLEIICGVREYGRIWGCIEFVSQWVAFRSIGIFWKVFGGAWISPFFSPPSLLNFPTFSEPSA